MVKFIAFEALPDGLIAFFFDVVCRDDYGKGSDAFGEKFVCFSQCRQPDLNGWGLEIAEDENLIHVNIVTSGNLLQNDL